MANITCRCDVCGKDRVVKLTSALKDHPEIPKGWVEIMFSDMRKLTDPAILETVAEVIGRYFSNPNNW